MSFTGPLEDRIAVRELHDRYADAAFRGDKQAWLDCWAQDCVWITHFGEKRGHEQLAGQWDQLWETFAALAFFTTVGAIEVGGDRGTTRAFVREIMLPKAGTAMKIVGQYDDEIVREGGMWRFARRAYSVLQREVVE
jgi:uncharacterized protein (TIGR02246 family)